MIKLYTDRRMLDHVPPPSHPERPDRLLHILRHLERSGLDQACGQGSFREVDREDLSRVHRAEYLTWLDRFDIDGFSQIEVDTWISPGSLLAARLAAGASVAAVNDVLLGQTKQAVCLVRPPGHHARPGEAMGFCLYGNIAIAAAHAISTHWVSRVLVVDWDVHHGNGTQEMFYDDESVAFFSIHRYPFYPGSGTAGETGTGRGLGWTKNVPVAYGTSRSDILSQFRASLEDFADKARPELVLISAGFDAHVEDPIGDLGLETEDFIELTRIVQDVAATHAGGRIVSLLEGGYNVPVLCGCVEAHIRTLGAIPES